MPQEPDKSFETLMAEAGVPAELPPDIERRAREIAAGYTYTVTPDPTSGGGYIGTVAELPTGAAHADDPQSCLTQIINGATLAVATCLMTGRTPPKPQSAVRTVA